MSDHYTTPVEDRPALTPYAPEITHPAPNALCADQTARPVGDALRGALRCVEAAMTSCENDGYKCACRKFGWQFDAEAHQCSARHSGARAALAQTQEATGQGARDEFPVGTKVQKASGEYDFPGTVVASFAKLGGQRRYVVEDDRRSLHIFSASNLRLAFPDSTPILQEV